MNYITLRNVTRHSATLHQPRPQPWYECIQPSPQRDAQQTAFKCGSFTLQSHCTDCRQAKCIPRCERQLLPLNSSNVPYYRGINCDSYCHRNLCNVRGSNVFVNLGLLKRLRPLRRLRAPFSSQRYHILGHRGVVFL